jgi:hypothetical protein
VFSENENFIYPEFRKPIESGFMKEGDISNAVKRRIIPSKLESVYRNSDILSPSPWKRP